MKKLFLASIASLTLDKILPLLPATPDKLRVAFVPTAADLYEDKSWLYKDRNNLAEMGFQVMDVTLKGKTKESLRVELEKCDVIFVGGGNTFYLLQEAKKSGFDEVVKELIHQGIVYIGSSAGSALLSPTIAYIEGMDDPADAPELRSYDSLGIIDFLLFPHYGDPEYKDQMNQAIKKWKAKGYPMKLLTNNQALIIDGDKSELVEV